MPETKKPLGVVLIALYSGFFGMVSLPLGGCALLIVGQASGAGVMVSVFAFGLMVLGFLLLAVAYGLWTAQPWARNFTAGIYAVSIPLGLLAIFPIFPGTRMSLENTLLQIIGIVIDVVIISYVAKPEMKLLYEGVQQPRRGFDEISRREPH